MLETIIVCTAWADGVRRSEANPHQVAHTCISTVLQSADHDTMTAVHPGRGEYSQESVDCTHDFY